MKKRPILFSAPMVRALLDGRKTQTRRVVKFKGADLDHFISRISNKVVCCPYGQPGDRLWVREAWRIGAWQVDKGNVAIDYLAGPAEKSPWIAVPEDPDDYHGARVFEKLWIQSNDDCVKAGLRPDDDGRYKWAVGESPCRVRPSIHMPRWASRITLEITGVRVERLQDISEADSIAEGIAHCNYRDLWRNYLIQDPNVPTGFESPIHSYLSLWDSINGVGAAVQNPWVWVVEFKRVEGGAG